MPRLLKSLELFLSMFSKEQVSIQKISDRLIDLVGNIFILILEYIPGADRDTLLNMLFLLQEYQIKYSQIPLVSLEFEVWEQGPVQKDLFADLSGNMFLMNHYVERYVEDGRYKFKARRAFDEKIFRQGDAESMRLQLAFYKTLSPAEIEDRLKGRKCPAKGRPEDSLWYRTAEKYNVLKQLENLEFITTNIPVDFTLLFDKEEDKEEYLFNKAAEKGTQRVR